MESYTTSSSYYNEKYVSIHELNRNVKHMMNYYVFDSLIHFKGNDCSNIDTHPIDMRLKPNLKPFLSKSDDVKTNWSIFKRSQETKYWSRTVPEQCSNYGNHFFSVFHQMEINENFFIVLSRGNYSAITQLHFRITYFRIFYLNFSTKAKRLIIDRLTKKPSVNNGI